MYLCLHRKGNGIIMYYYYPYFYLFVNKMFYFKNALAVTKKKMK